MCVYSAVIDHYRDRIPTYPPPIYPNTIPWHPPTPNPDVEEIKKLLKDFKEAVQAAKRVDELTGQPDCEKLDEKAELEERVARLEKALGLEE